MRDVSASKIEASLHGEMCFVLDVLRDYFPKHDLLGEVLASDNDAIPMRATGCEEDCGGCEENCRPLQGSQLQFAPPAGAKRPSSQPIRTSARIAIKAAGTAPAR